MSYVEKPKPTWRCRLLRHRFEPKVIPLVDLVRDRGGYIPDNDEMTGILECAWCGVRTAPATGRVFRDPLAGRWPGQRASA